MKHYLFTILLLVTISFSFAQQNEKEAFQKFKKARQAYQSNNYADAANLLSKTKELLGSTNIRIQPMLIKSLAKIQDWHRANTEIDTYYGLNPDQKLVEYQEIVTIDRQVDVKVKEDQDLYNTAKRNKSVTTMQSYLDSFPYGKYREEVRLLLSNQKDENAWDMAKNGFNTRAYEAYLAKYPNGIHANEAKQQIIRWDNVAYDKASSEGTQSALNYYLSNYPNGQYRRQIKNQLTIRKEEDAYAATKSGKLTDFENYIRNYPNGKYATQINKAIENYMFDKAESSFNNKYYSQAASNYQNYINRFPNGENIDKAKSRFKRATNKSKQRSSSYFGFTYESQGAFGITSGKLNKDKLGFYFNLRVTPQVFDIEFTEPENEIPEELVPENEKIGVASLSLGFSYPISYPVWIYAGGGVNYQERFVEENNETLFYKVTGEEQMAFYPEAGLKIRLGRSTTLIGGVVYVRDELLYKIGIGF
ncbi:outer membrane protein assembly factor BamD [Tenacibaculum tangerinum]|uniref:Outer membrane protein assembly factor BamD n=1 Tax=Tenacibaculum tangerinum TaxID=3038772 RepID=A0ABY8KZ53_9FLAO|nr:outer membrane protein assembly factor BamD [Tenacibaculum tangerinum]WGH74516.1 outer membrane protein assembly factor BamD [Tenacibaculum tangerinum]